MASRVRSTIPVGSFGPRPPSASGLVETWCHTCSSTPRVMTPSNRDSSASMTSSSGWIDLQTVRQVVPSCRARPCTEACSRRSCPMAHQHARVVTSARGRARSSCCSVKDPAGQVGSAQHQVRLRQTSSTGLPKHGTSTRRTVRRPWPCATTPHEAQQPSSRAWDSTSTRPHVPRRPIRSLTSTTWNPSSPTSRSHREQ